MFGAECDKFVCSAEKIAELEALYLERFAHRNLAKLFSLLAKGKVEDVNASLLRVPLVRDRERERGPLIFVLLTP